MEDIKKDEELLVRLLGKIQKKESQLKLLQETMNSVELIQSKIVSSIQPRVGIKFNHDDLEEKKNQLIRKLRKDLLQVAIEDKKRELTKCTCDFESKKKNYEDNCNATPMEFYNKLQKGSALVTKRINNKMNQKIAFHCQEPTSFKRFTARRKFETKKKPSTRRKKLNRRNYRRKYKEKKKDKIANLAKVVQNENIVINLSSAEIPNATTIYLAKGLGFVKSNKVDIQDLKFDTLEFLRKVEWKAFFKDLPEEASNSIGVHENLKVSSGKSPNLQHPLIDDIKTKMMGWISNHEKKTPNSNLTQLELRGRKWILDKIKNEELFVTKADKGGATLIMNYDDVKEAIEAEIYNTDKFEEVSKNADNHLSEVTKKVVSLAKSLGEKKTLTTKDKMLICGLNNKNRLKLEPEYKAEPPYAYPLFKIHKLSEKQIIEKKIPPNRLVHASKFGPLYRIEKWCSPYFTKISQSYCEDEFLLDTNDLLKQIDELNNVNTFKDENINLFTLDVEKLYPSIQPDKALLSINETLARDTTTEQRIKDALATLVKFCFDEAYVTYKNSCFKGKKGIPTGGCISRQIADIFLHWVLFFKNNLIMDNLPELPFWRRFIDDCIGIWKGTKRTFLNFVRKLNTNTNKFGIHFPIDEVKFGKSVDFLDVTLYLDKNNTIHYKGYSKPTDAKRFLNPNSFHPRHVFKSVPMSQMIRVLNRNSKQDSLNTQLNGLKKELVKSGYKEDILDKIENELQQKQRTNVCEKGVVNTELPKRNTITFPISYFDGLNEFKKLIYDLGEDLKTIMGDVKITFAIRKGRSIGNTVVKNKSLSIGTITDGSGQKCNVGGCLQCPLVTTTNTMNINNKIIKIPNHLNCKTSNAIYLWKCKLCNKEDCYFGRTVQKCHKRTNGHRGCFGNGDSQKSALSMHAKDKHPENISLDNFEIAVVKQASPRNLKREEFRVVDKYRTKCLGLNRYKTFI